MDKVVNTDMLILSREIDGLNQTQFSKIIGIDQTHISSFERGARNVTKAVVKKWSQATGFKESFFYQTYKIKPVGICGLCKKKTI